MRVEFINPFVAATQDVFRTMLNCSIVRGPLSLNLAQTSMYEVSGLIGISGACRGMVVVSLGGETAIRAAEVMLGSRPAELDADVIDAIGELTNMIAGGAKTRLEQYELAIGLPTVICGSGQRIMYPSGTSPIVIPFDSDIGPLSVQVGFAEVASPVVAT